MTPPSRLEAEKQQQADSQLSAAESEVIRIREAAERLRREAALIAKKNVPSPPRLDSSLRFPEASHLPVAYTADPEGLE